MSSRIRVLPVAAMAIGVLFLAGCKADDLNIVVLSARAAGDKCDFSDDSLYASRGSLDIAQYTSGGQTVQTERYYQVFSWENNLQKVPLSVNGQVIDPNAGNDFIADSVVYEYQYSDPSVVLAPESANMHAVITAGGDPTKNSVPADLIQPGAFAAIDNSALGPSPQTLLVTFQIFGKLAAGSSNHTNKVSFPLTVYRSVPKGSPVDCGTTLVLNGGACGVPGRDQIVSCKSP